MFDAGLVDVSAGSGTLVVEFDASVDAGVTAARYTIDVQTTFDDRGVGRDVENRTSGLAAVLVDIAQTTAPTLNAAVAGQTMVTGSAPANSTVTVFVNGVPAPTAIADASGSFTVTVPTLFAGQHITGTASSAGEVVSEPTTPDLVVIGVGGVAPCGDGRDNDSDGHIDFPDDPGCSSATDLDETDVPACSDGVDNDGDTLTDFPDDPSCSSFVDDDESGEPACSDGADNDGDGNTDFPEDPGCESAEDPSEATIPACANGRDDDGDGRVDYPADLGCASARDNDETEQSDSADASAPSGGGAPNPPGSDVDAGPSAVPQGEPPDLGGVSPSGSGSSSSDGGCGCRMAGSTSNAGWLTLLALAGLVRKRRSR